MITVKKLCLAFLVILLSAGYSFSQNTGIDKETWAAKPTIYTVDAKYSKESAVIVYDKREIEYADEDKNEMAEYYTLHKIIHINTDRGIESFNKIYLGFNENSDIVDVKARTILPGGKIIELDKNNIKDLKESDGNVYKIFALDGLTKGCDVEYFYTLKRSASFFGREVIQSSFPTVKTIFKLVKPERLRFEIKPYNCQVTTVDTVIGKKQISQCIFENIPGAEGEKYAFYNANLERLEFKLCYNLSVHKDERLFTWNELVKKIYSMYTYYSDKGVKKTDDIVKGNGWGNIDGEEKKIIAVENYIKKTYVYNEDLKSEEDNRLETVIQNKTGGIIGMVRLYSAIFQNLGVGFQFVLTGDRNKFIIDKSFENWDNCDYPVLYFPTEKKYISPTQPEYRYPLINPIWGEANGLFCKTTSIGSFFTAIAEIRNIPLEDYHDSYDNIESRLELNGNLDSLTVDVKQIFGGYPAVEYRDAFNFLNDEQQKKLIKQSAKMTAGTDNILFSEVLNKDFEDGNKDFVLHVKTKSGELIERAGNKLLVKIGLAIGPQEEMYQEKPRQQPANIQFGHVEKRTIEMVIPDGYSISNLNDLKINQTFNDNGEETMGFVSDYTIKGNVLVVNIMEHYAKTIYPLSQFDQFRRIINASSDFNKVTLVLEKKL